MDLLNLTEEESLILEELEATTSIRIGRRPHPSAFGVTASPEAIEAWLSDDDYPRMLAEEAQARKNAL